MNQLPLSIFFLNTDYWGMNSCFRGIFITSTHLYILLGPDIPAAVLAVHP